MKSSMQKALAIFAKEPQPGYVKTRLVPPLTFDEAAELYRCMLWDTLDTFTGFPDTDVILFLDGHRQGLALPDPLLPPLLPQEGEDLGARMTNAFSLLFSRGYDHVALIGSDIPDLPSAHVSRAFRQLASGAEAVFGPSDDGGYYLVALSRPCPDLFISIPWSTDTVLHRSMEKGRSAGIATALAPEWYDLDSFSDLHRLMSGTGSTLRTGRFLSCLLQDRPTLAPALYLTKPPL